MKHICSFISFVLPIGSLIAILYMCVFMIPQRPYSAPPLATVTVSMEPSPIPDYVPSEHAGMSASCPDEASDAILHAIYLKLGYFASLKEIEALSPWAVALQDKCQRDAALFWLSFRRKDTLERTRVERYAAEHPVPKP